VAVSKRRIVGVRPSTAPVRRDNQQTSAVGQHTPEFAQQTVHLLSVFQAVDEQNSVH